MVLQTSNALNFDVLPLSSYVKKVRGVHSSLSLVAGHPEEDGYLDGAGLDSRFASISSVAATVDGTQRKLLNEAWNRFYVLDESKIKLVHPCEEDIVVAEPYTPIPVAMYRIWPEDCGLSDRPHAPIGSKLHINEGSGESHYAPKVCGLTSTTAIYCWDYTGGSWPGYYGGIRACTVTRSGMELSAGPVVELDSTAMWDLPSRILKVSDTMALIAYDYETGSYSYLRLALVQVSGTSISVVDTYDGPEAHSGFVSMSKVPGASKFIATGGGDYYSGGFWITVADVSGTSISATSTFVEGPAAYEAEVVALSATKLLIGFWDQSIWTILPGRISGTSITWGSPVSFPDNPFSGGNANPIAGRLSDDSAVFFYHASPPGWSWPGEPLPHSCSNSYFESRAVRVDVDDDLSITFFTPCIVDGGTKSTNTAPFCLDDSRDGRIVYSYDVIQEDAVPYYDAPVTVNIGLADGDTGLYGYGTRVAPVDEGGSFLYWGNAISLFPGTDVALFAVAEPGDGNHAQSNLFAVDVS